MKTPDKTDNWQIVPDAQGSPESRPVQRVGPPAIGIKAIGDDDAALRRKTKALVMRAGLMAVVYDGFRLRG